RAKALDADLRTRKVREDAHVAVIVTRSLAQHLHALDLRLARTVREVQPCHVQTGPYHPGEHSRLVGGRAERCHDLGSALSIHGGSGGRGGHSGALLEHRDGWQALALDELEEGTTSGGDVGDAVLHAILLDRGERIAAAGQ